MWELFTKMPPGHSGYQKMKFLAYLSKQGSLPEIFLSHNGKINILAENPIMSVFQDPDIELGEFCCYVEEDIYYRQKF